MEDATTKLNEEKVREAFSNQIKLHIILRNGDWRNGFVVDADTSTFIFDDVINGKEAIFFLELVKVEPYMEKEKC